MEIWQGILTAVGVLSSYALLIKWLKAGLDDVRKTQGEIKLNIAENYSKTREIVEMIDLINKPVHQLLGQLTNDVVTLKTDVKEINANVTQILINQSNRSS